MKSYFCLMNTPVTIRKAVKEDALFMAERILWAIGVPDAKDSDAETLSTVCAMKDVLYSYENTLIAEVDGERVGIMISYDGALYSTLRVKTFSNVGDALKCDFSTILSSATLLLPSGFLSITVFSNEWTLCIRCPNYWSFLI